MKRERSVKIIATLGPKTESIEAIEELYKTGVDVFRLNFSHGDHAEQAARVKNIRALEKKFNRPMTVLADMQGPKLRLSTFAKGSAEIQTGDTFVLDQTGKPGDNTRVTVPHPEIFDSVTPGTRLLIDDGKVALEVTHNNGKEITTQVVVGGTVSDKKGLNVPNAMLNMSALTQKDHEDLVAALDMDVDWIALSFVQRVEDVLEAREIVGNRASIISKIEKVSAVEQLDGIIDESDAIMIARGDLGVELPAEQVPAIQKRSIRMARRKSTPVVVATQMLDSMVNLPTPTRAEASDVANAVYDGADAVMLSAETTVGDYPVETVSMMDRIIKQVEQDPYYHRQLDELELAGEPRTAEAITMGATEIAKKLDAKVIVAYTESGTSALRVSHNRPDVTILALSPSAQIARRMNLVWGVYPDVIGQVSQFSALINQAKRYIPDHGFGQKGDYAVIVAGVPVGMKGSTNTIRVTKIKE